MMKRPTLPVFNSYHHKDSLLIQFDFLSVSRVSPVSALRKTSVN